MKALGKIILGVVVAIAIINFLGDKESDTTEKKVASEQTKQTEKPVVKEKKPATPEEQTKKVLKENKYADVISVNGQFEAEPYTVHVELMGKENLTTNMTVTSMRLAIREVLYTVKNLNLKFSNVGVSVKYPLTDQYGNSNDEFVIKSNFGAETIDKLNKDKNKLETDNLPVIADEWWEHPALSK